MTRTITDPHTGKVIHAPAHFLAPPRTMAPVPMREWLSRRLAAPAVGIGSPTIEAGRGTENAK